MIQQSVLLLWTETSSLLYTLDAYKQEKNI